MSIEERFERDMKLIVDECREKFGDLEAIILYGGYGRDEGAWYCSDVGWSPYNDYDILIVSEQKVAKSIIDNLRKELASRIGINWVDISIMSSKKISNLKPSIYNYDLKYGSKVLFGNRKILDLIDLGENIKLPLIEIRNLFLTRLFTLIDSPKSADFDTDLNENEALFFRNQLAKSVLASVDVQLILSGQYNTSYVKRCGLLLDKSSNDKELVEWALKEKLTPTYQTLDRDRAKQLYRECSRYFMKHMKIGLSNLYNLEISSASKFLAQYFIDRDIIARRIYYGLLLNGYMEKTLRCHALQVYYAFAFLNEPSDYRARDKLSQSFTCDGAEYDLIRKEIAKLRLSL